MRVKHMSMEGQRPAVRADFEKLPRHVAIIMDGNGRWAKMRGLPRTEGHKAGAKAVGGLLKRFREYDIHHLTLYAFSTENLREMSGVALENGLITSGVRDNFIKTYVGFDVGETTFEEKKAIMLTSEFADMPVYPTEGCIKKIDGIWVVKLCDTIPN